MVRCRCRCLENLEGIVALSRVKKDYVHVRSYAHIYAVLLMVFILANILLFFSKESSAKVNIPDKDYSRLWGKYAVNDYNKIPEVEFPYDDCFRKAAKKHNIPVTLLMAVARGESDFNPRAKSSKDCYGIMQIQWPGTAKDLGFRRVEELYAPCANINAGARYLRKMLNLHDENIHLALASYNYGPGNIRKGINPLSIPEGANWYSGYIFHHLGYILDKSKVSVEKKPGVGRLVYIREHKLPINMFHSPYLAKNFLGYLQEKLPELRFDYFRTPLGKSYIVLLYKNDAEKKQGIKALHEKIFWTVDESKAFM